MATIEVTSSVSRAQRGPAPLSALSKLTAAALTGGMLSLIYAQVFLIGQFQPELTVFAVLELTAAMLIVLLPRRRWLPILGTVFGILVVAGNSGPIVYDLLHPASFRPFAFMTVAMAIAFVGAVAGLAAVVQNYRRPAAERRAPRGMAAAVVGMAMLCVGAIAVAAIPQQAGAAVSPEIMAELPAVVTPGFSFEMPAITMRAGETVALRLDNPHSAPHSFDIDELNVHVPMPAGGSSMALFRATEPGRYTYYCQIPGHRELGMEGVLVVER